MMYTKPIIMITVLMFINILTGILVKYLIDIFIPTNIILLQCV